MQVTKLKRFKAAKAKTRVYLYKKTSTTNNAISAYSNTCSIKNQTCNATKDSNQSTKSDI